MILVYPCPPRRPPSPTTRRQLDRRLAVAGTTLSRNLARLAWQAAEPVYPAEPDAEPSRQSALYHRGEPRPVLLRRIPHDYSHDLPTHLLEEGDVPRWYAVKAGHSLAASHHPIDVAITSFVDESQQPDLALVLADVRRTWRDWRVSARTEVALVFCWCETAARQAYYVDRRERRKRAA